MKVKINQVQANFIESFNGDKQKATYFISRWGWGYPLTDGKGNEYTDGDITPFKQSEWLKMVQAVSWGYEVVKPWFKFYNFVTSQGRQQVWYTGKDEKLTPSEPFALHVEEDSEEYNALRTLGFLAKQVNDYEF